MLNFSDIGNISIGEGRVPLSNNENQWLTRGNDTTRGTDSDRKNNTDEFTNMGNNYSYGREWEFLTPPSWDNSQYGLGNHYEEWEQEREFQSNQTREEIRQVHNNGNTTKEQLFDNHNSKEIYERDTRRERVK